MEPRCVCNPLTNRGSPFDETIGYFFGQCVYNTSDYIGFFFGLINVCIWFTIHFPQLIESHRTKAKGLSPVMLMLWVTGDLCGLLSLFLTGQFGVIFFTQVYYFTMDSLLFLQYAYFTFWYKKEVNNKNIENDDDSTDINSLQFTSYSHRITQSLPKDVTYELTDLGYHDGDDDHVDIINNNDTHSHNAIAQPTTAPAPNYLTADHDDDTAIISTTLPPPPDELNASISHTNLFSSPSHLMLLSTCILAITLITPTSATVVTVKSFSTLATTITKAAEAIATTLQDVSHIPLCTGAPIKPWQNIVGIICGWLCSIIYSPSRLPQVILNFKRKSTYGLSKPFVFLALFTGFLYGGSILIPSYTYDKSNGFTSGQWWLQTGPFVVSTVIGTMLNLTISWQIWAYRHKSRADAIGADIPEEDVRAQEEYDLKMNANFLLLGHSTSSSYLPRSDST